MLRRVIKACHHFALSLSSPRHKKSIKTSPNRNVLFISISTLAASQVGQ